MAFPRIIPHSDGAGVVDLVGAQAPQTLTGQRVWCYGAQSYRPFGTAAEFVVVPADHVIALPERVSFAQGACLGIPGITAHRAVHVAGPIEGTTVMVQGAGGAVGLCAVQLARVASAPVIGTVRSSDEEKTARAAGAHEVVMSDHNLVSAVKAIVPAGVHHIVEVASAANIESDIALMKLGGSLATYASNHDKPTIPLLTHGVQQHTGPLPWQRRFPEAAKLAAANELNRALAAGWAGFPVAEQLLLQRLPGLTILWTTYKNLVGWS